MCRRWLHWADNNLSDKYNDRKAWFQHQNHLIVLCGVNRRNPPDPKSLSKFFGRYITFSAVKFLPGKSRVGSEKSDLHKWKSLHWKQITPLKWISVHSLLSQHNLSTLTAVKEALSAVRNCFQIESYTYWSIWYWKIHVSSGSCRRPKKQSWRETWKRFFHNCTVHNFTVYALA